MRWLLRGLSNEAARELVWGFVAIIIVICVVTVGGTLLIEQLLSEKVSTEHYNELSIQGQPIIIAGKVGDPSILIGVIVTGCDSVSDVADAIHSGVLNPQLSSWTTDNVPNYGLGQINYEARSIDENGVCQYLVWYLINNLSKYQASEGWPA